jgi:hypothetical protein
MPLQKQTRELSNLAVFSLVAWFITTFACIAVWYIKGGGGLGLPDPTNKPVSPQMYAASLSTSKALIFNVIPALTSGYLLLGLLLLRARQKINKHENVQGSVPHERIYH